VLLRQLDHLTAPHLAGRGKYFHHLAEENMADTFDEQERAGNAADGSVFAGDQIVHLTTVMRDA
jgi:hypothetical protein